MNEVTLITGPCEFASEKHMRFSSAARSPATRHVEQSKRGGAAEEREETAAEQEERPGGEEEWGK